MASVERSLYAIRPGFTVYRLGQRAPEYLFTIARDCGLVDLRQLIELRDVLNVFIEDEQIGPR